MAEDSGEEAFRIGPGTRELIGVTNPSRLYFDQNLSSLWSVEIDLRHFQRLAGLECHCGAHLHGSLLFVATMQKDSVFTAPFAVALYKRDSRLRLRHDPDVRFRRLPALRILFLCVLVAP